MHVLSFFNGFFILDLFSQRHLLRMTAGTLQGNHRCSSFLVNPFITYLALLIIIISHSDVNHVIRL